jgi:hypothetical protein
VLLEFERPEMWRQPKGSRAADCVLVAQRAPASGGSATLSLRHRRLMGKVGDKEILGPIRCRSQRYFLAYVGVSHGTILNEAKSRDHNGNSPLPHKKVGPHATMPPRRHLFFITGNGEHVLGGR